MRYLDCWQNYSEQEALPIFKVSVAYESIAHKQRAAAFLEHMATTLQPDDPNWLHWAAWNFRSTPRQMSLAVDQAATADAIVIVAHEREIVPEVLERWVEQWLPEKTNPCALIALLENTRGDIGGHRVIYSYLQQVAYRGNLAFFADNGFERTGGTVRISALADSDSEQASPLVWPVHYRLWDSNPKVDFN